MIRQNQKYLTQIYAFIDFVAIQISFHASWWLKFDSGWFPYLAPLPFSTYQAWCLFYGGITLLTGFFLGFYSPKRKKSLSYESYKIVQVHFFSIFLLLSALYIVKEVHISRAFLILFVVNSIIFIFLYRSVVKKTLSYYRKRGFNKQFLLILGAGSLGTRFYSNLRKHPEFGYEVVGFLDDDTEKNRVYDKPILGTVDQLENMLNQFLIDEVIVALPLQAYSKFNKIIEVCEKAGVKIHIIPDFFDLLPAKSFFDSFAGIPLISIREIPLDDLLNRFFKRLFDIVFSCVVLILSAPLMILMAILIKTTSKGPVIFYQERVGLNRRTFVMYKFRTMSQQDAQTSDTEWTINDDPRRTKFGAFLRSTSLDELPQFFNVLRGEMSVVGPRPERPYYVEQFKEKVPKYMVKHYIRPGITGWAQAEGLRGDTSIEERIKHDIYYIENWSFLFDIKIIYKTLIKGLLHKNAY